MRHPYEVWIAALTICVLLAGRARVARGAEKNATGTWTWSKALQSGEVVIWTLDLKQDGEKLRGTFAFSGGRVTPISEGKVKKDEVSFEVGGNTPTGVIKAVYTGKIEDDTIEFKVQSERNGKRAQAQAGFKAKRVVSGINAGK